MTRAEYKLSYRKAAIYSWLILIADLVGLAIVSPFRSVFEEDGSLPLDLAVSALALLAPLILIYAVGVTIGWASCIVLDKVAPESN
jgi:hypothetical protein